MAARIAFLGPVGTYTEEAALLYDAQADLQPYPNITAVGLAVAAGETAEGVVPIENSLEGSVNFTLDLLISQPDLFIRQEVVIPIDHYLVARPGTNLDQVQVVFSHPQALAQCHEYLERTFPDAEQMPSLSTALAVSDAQNSPVPAVAIASRRAAALNNAEIMAGPIQDMAANVTRFVVLAASDHQPTGQDKTSLCFSFDKDVPGQLYGVMGEFALREHQPSQDRVQTYQGGPGAVLLLDRLRRPPGGPSDAGSGPSHFRCGHLASSTGFLSPLDAGRLAPIKNPRPGWAKGIGNGRRPPLRVHLHTITTFPYLDGTVKRRNGRAVLFVFSNRH